MITGEVGERLEAAIRLVVVGPSGRSAEIESVIDTGFTEYLTLPRETVESLALRYRESGEFVLADGDRVEFDLYECSVLWHGIHRDVLAAVAEGGSLVGMSVLHGSRLQMDVIVGGEVTISRLHIGS